jgi:hypothetical protein
MHPLLKVYRECFCINSFDLRVDGGTKARKRWTRNRKEQEEEPFSPPLLLAHVKRFNYVLRNNTVLLRPVEKYFHGNKAIKYLAIACMNNILQRAEKQEIWPTFRGWYFLKIDNVKTTDSRSRNELKARNSVAMTTNGSLESSMWRYLIELSAWISLVFLFPTAFKSRLYSAQLSSLQHWN